MGELVGVRPEEIRSFKALQRKTVLF